ncbi:NAD-dependent epimerase/dehydratase family protein [Erwinia sp. CPCC 100877]|nr:NAD-dependent epimerase/dehydratase family protein [Erwinia sp. CPCC 100877]
MKKVAIVGLGWLGMPLALSLISKGWQVTGSKTTEDGVEAARMCGLESYLLQLTPEPECDSDDLDALLAVDALVITLPARRSGKGENFYLLAVQEMVDSALAHAIPHIVFISSTSVYGDAEGVVTETSPLKPVSDSGRMLCELEHWLHDLPGTSVDILRLSGLVGPERHPGRFFAGKRAPHANHVVNLVHLEDAVAAIELLLETRGGGRLYNLCAPGHPTRSHFYPLMSRRLGLPAPLFSDDASESFGRQVDGDLICRELGFCYRHPDPERMPLE